MQNNIIYLVVLFSGRARADPDKCNMADIGKCFIYLLSLFLVGWLHFEWHLKCRFQNSGINYISKVGEKKFQECYNKFQKLSNLLVFLCLFEATILTRTTQENLLIYRYRYFFKNRKTCFNIDAQYPILAFGFIKK